MRGKSAEFTPCVVRYVRGVTQRSRPGKGLVSHRIRLQTQQTASIFRAMHISLIGVDGAIPLVSVTSFPRDIRELFRSSIISSMPKRQSAV